MERPHRYQRQELLLGQAAQERLGRATAVVVGCGGLGCTTATLLARAGIGRLRLIDPDVVDQVNLHRQLLFTERHAAAGMPKVVAAAEQLRQVNSEIRIEPITEQLTAQRALALCHDADVILDGLDNQEGRWVLNDAAVKLGVPWVHGGAVASYGLVMTIVPGQGPCLRCLYQEPLPPEATPTCRTVGIIAPVATVVASFQAAEAMKLVAGVGELPRSGEAGGRARLTAIDLLAATVQQVEVRRNEACPCCVERRFRYLAGDPQPGGTDD